MNRKLKIDELNYVVNEVEQKQKSVAGAYVLGILFGQLGLHRIYLDKFKSGLGRAVLTAATTVTLLVVGLGARSGTSFYDTISVSLVQNALLSIVFIGLLTAHIVWSIVDLFLIPGWITELNKTNEEVAIEKAIQSRFVEERLLKNTITTELLEEVTSEVRANIADELKRKTETITHEEIVRIKEQFDIADEKYLEELIQEELEQEKKLAELEVSEDVIEEIE